MNANELLAESDRKRIWVREGGSIGRIEGNDWVLPDPRSEISRVHARVYFENDLYYIEDLSTNGVFVGDHEHRIDRIPHAIANGEKLFIGHYQINVELVEEERESDTLLRSSYISSSSSYDDHASHLSQPEASFRSIEPFSFDKFPETKPKKADGANKASKAKLACIIPENWLNSPIENVVTDRSEYDSSPVIDPLIDILESEPEQPVNIGVGIDEDLDLPPEIVPVIPKVKAVSTKKARGDNESCADSTNSEQIAAQKAALAHTLEMLLESFDIDYVDYIMMKKGETREDLIRRLFDDVFYKTYQKSLNEPVEA